MTAIRFPRAATRALLLSAVLLGLSPTALADDGPTSAEPSSSSDYRRAIDAALSEFEAQRYEEARALFLEAHALDPNARTLRGIALCAFELGDYVGAITYFEQALASDRRTLDTRQRAQAEQLLARSRTFVGTVRLTVEPATATVTVDGRPPTIRDGAILLNPGDHEIRVEAEGFASDSRRVRVEPSAPIPLSIVLVQPAARVSPVATVALSTTEDASSTSAAPANEAPATRRRAHPVDAASGIAYGVGGAGLVLFASFGIRALVLAKDHPTGCLSAGTCTESSLDAQDRSALTADIGLGLAIAGTTTGLLLQFLRSPRETGPATSVSGFVAPRAGGLALRGRF